MYELHELDRRRFLKRSAAGCITGMLAGGASSIGATIEGADSDKRIKKAVKFGMVGGDGTIMEKFQLLKELGYDGVELDSPSNINKQEVLEARDETELPIHGVVDSAHWRDTLSNADAEVRARGVEALKTAIRDSKFYGGTSVLLVPATVGKTVSYDQAYTRSQAEIKKAIPLAEELGIDIALENVWNNFLLSPLETARYIDQLDSERVGAYFDVGNVVRYGWPEQWVRILGNRIKKLDIKEYSRKKQTEEGIWKGFDVKILDGDCDWPAVMAALRDIDFRGWATAEVSGGDEQRLRDIARRMDRALGN